MTDDAARPTPPPGSPSDDARHVRRAWDLALQNVDEGGRPFGCVVVDAATGEVLAEARNQVAQSGDKTAHAEVVAIRELAARGRDTLEGCDVFVTAYPCPMCLGALYYAQPDRLVHGATREQEDEHYEDGNALFRLRTFYDEFAKDPKDRALRAEQLEPDDPTRPFREYTARHADA
ncbi:nucleoside deaminase [Patulibacter sp.]|uniref:nucleoside deaminase n=1 Tax=Patulibacter sp. TaxID=1912859 RepID=UPI00271CBC68|nr:nucleoside deaminase [Patulibacter sp.]MDO9410899.1 nucleoside deaminase [Patulibacter sp.]